MSSTTITRISHSEALKAKSETDWDRVRAMTDEEIEANVDEADDGFIWSAAVMMPPIGKEAVSIRLDADVLEYFKRGGKGYQTRINTVLRSYMLAQK